jgi:hypothetical protein
MRGTYMVHLVCNITLRACTTLSFTLGWKWSCIRIDKFAERFEIDGIFLYPFLKSGFTLVVIYDKKEVSRTFYMKEFFSGITWRYEVG